MGAIVLCGSGDHFCSGHDLGSPEQVADIEANPYQPGVRGDMKKWRDTDSEMCLKWRSLPKPTICAVKEIDNGMDSYGLYRSRRQAKQFLRKIAREHSLCLQNLGLETQSENACFAFQLNQCKGACCELEKADDYNARLLAALEIKKRLDWPWTGPILVKEASESIERQYKTHLVYQWCYYGLVDSEDAMHDYLQQPLPEFDLDIYHILVRFLFNKSKTRSKLFSIQPLEKITTSKQSVA